MENDRQAIVITFLLQSNIVKPPWSITHGDVLPANATVHVTPPTQVTVFTILQMLDLVKCQSKFLGKYIGKYDEVVDAVEQIDTFLIASKARRLPQILDDGGIRENVLFVNG